MKAAFGKYSIKTGLGPSKCAVPSSSLEKNEREDTIIEGSGWQETRAPGKHCVSSCEKYHHLLSLIKI